MLVDPAFKYAPAPAVALSGRQWPERTLRRAPRWLSTDLRDGNQAMFEPMAPHRKLQLFRALCEVGLKEIEVGFPSASQADFDFVRLLIEGRHVPEQVTIGVLTQAREDLIARSFDALRGARRAIMHVYNATAPVFREQVFGMGRAQVQGLAVRSVQTIRELAALQSDTAWVLQYSPEVFTSTELDFALDVCNAVTQTWDPNVQRPLILNLPATVEVSTPNVYADQIEWMHNRLARRTELCLSLHPHNDRGTAVAAAELGLLAGADRVEGCLFGNGERTGNVDLVTLALNLYTQGVSPGLGFSDINAIARTVEACTQLPIHPRHPYVGDLVFTAFSGSHQDAIRKGMAARRPTALWQVPYLPIDPTDVGRSYASIIRVNSQSGKGGVAYLMETVHGLRMPRRMQVDFAAAVQKLAESSGSEVDADQLWSLFCKTYANATHSLRCRDYSAAAQEPGRFQLQLTIERDGRILPALQGDGASLVQAAVQGLHALMPGVELRCSDAGQRPAQAGLAVENAAVSQRHWASVELAWPLGLRGQSECFGVGFADDADAACLHALLAAASRLLARTP